MIISSSLFHQSIFKHRCTSSPWAKQMIYELALQHPIQIKSHCIKNSLSIGQQACEGGLLMLKNLQQLGLQQAATRPCHFCTTGYLINPFLIKRHSLLLPPCSKLSKLPPKNPVWSETCNKPCSKFCMPSSPPNLPAYPPEKQQGA